MTTKKVSQALVKILDKNKAMNIEVLDVHGLTSITDTMIIASGRSDRQVKALAEKVIETAKKLDMPLLGVEGLQEGEWVLVDLGEVILHLMRPATRIYYQLEKLWSTENQQATAPL